MLFSLSFQLNATAADDNASTGEDKHVILNMVDTDITVLIETISALTGETFIIDGNVRGKVDVVSKDKMSIKDAYRLFESTLEVAGFALVPSGNAIKVVPVSEARSKNIETRVEPPQGYDEKEVEDKLITQLIALKYADAKNVRTVLTPLVSKNSNIATYTDTNTLIVTDIESNLKRLLKIIEVIDVPGIAQKVSFIPLSYADPDTVTKTLSSIFKTSMSAEKDVSQKTLQFVSDERTNSVIFVASEDDTARIKKAIEWLDRETPKGKGKAHVYSLSHHDAEEMASILQAIPKEGSGTSGAGKEAAVVSGDITIAADKATNSLIIFADSADYAVIEDIIRKLDIPRSMVYIEVLIMEVSVDKQFELGINWSVFEDTTIGGETAVIGGGFNVAGVDPQNLLESAGGAVGVVSGALQITTSDGVQIVPNMGALIAALESNNDIHILQTPKLTATDNQEANFVVGKKVPYQTRTSTTDNETYNSYDYQSVGLTLKITPHIGEGRNVRLDIYTELSALTSNDVSTTTPTTRERTVETTVTVQDQNMLVLGGLIDDNTDISVSKVPLLGSIPILGRLFQYQRQQSNKTNLFIFITPRVVKNDSEANLLTQDVQDTMTPEEAEIIELYGPLKGRESITLPHTTESSE